MSRGGGLFHSGKGISTWACQAKSEDGRDGGSGKLDHDPRRLLAGGMNVDVASQRSVLRVSLAPDCISKIDFNVQGLEVSRSVHLTIAQKSIRKTKTETANDTQQQPPMVVGP